MSRSDRRASLPCQWAIAAVLLLALNSPAHAACDLIGRWVAPDDGKVLDGTTLFSQMSKRGIVLLGERHTSAEDHRWQLQTLAGLHALQPKIVIGFEMFPRAAQLALDRWVSGAIPKDAFLKETRWQEVWGYDAALYMPLFHFARQNRLPMRAINIDRKIISAIGAKGWEGVPEAERGGIGRPAPASEAYRKRLRAVFEQHGDYDDAAKKEAAFARFVEAQLAWDRAMAEALHAAWRDKPDGLVVGIIGRGHLEFGHGVPHQLADLGLTTSAVLLPEAAGEGCPELEAGLADAVFVVAGDETVSLPPKRLRLGVVIETGEGGVLVKKVVPGSVAEATGLIDGDVIAAAAGRPMREASDLSSLIGSLVPGIWLPLEIRRDGEVQSVVAKFPAEAGSEP